MGGFNRRQVVGGLGATAALASAPFGRTMAQGTDARPNIVFIMADDLGYADLGCTGSRMNRTPHIDSIAANGIHLTQGYANSAICSPTRTGLLTGSYQYRFPVGLEEPLAPPSPQGIGVPFDVETLPEVLRAQGDQTALVGKWHLGNPPLHSPLAHGYDHFFGIVPVEQPSAAVAKHFLIVHPVQPRERCTVTARLFYQDILFCFAVCQINASH